MTDLSGISAQTATLHVIQDIQCSTSKKGCNRLALDVNTSVAVFAEISLRSSRKIFIFIIKKYTGSKYQKINGFNFEKNFTGHHWDVISCMMLFWILLQKMNAPRGWFHVHRSYGTSVVFAKHRFGNPDKKLIAFSKVII